MSVLLKHGKRIAEICRENDLVAYFSPRSLEHDSFERTCVSDPDQLQDILTNYDNLAQHGRRRLMIGREFGHNEVDDVAKEIAQTLSTLRRVFVEENMDIFDPARE